MPDHRRAADFGGDRRGWVGGAVAFASANRVAMLEHSIYSVISPEGCASILWKDAEKMREAAEACG
jgi:acetyl-CoA carboxylase carboxyl transferase subunit alpha